MVALQDSLSAQVGVLGSLLISPELIGQVVTQVSDSDFTDPACKLVYQAIRAQFTSGQPTDAMTIRDKLGGGKEWSDYLVQLMELTPTAQNVWAYVPAMKEQARLAQIREISADLAEAKDLETAGAQLAKLNGLMSQRPGVRRMTMTQMLESFWNRHTTPHTYITWGFPKLDGQLFIDRGDMVVLGGFPSAGKTALAVSCAYHQSAQYRVGFYSLETSRYKLADRLIANRAEIAMGDIKRGALTEAQWGRAAEASPQITAHLLELIEASGMSARDIQADALANRYDVVYVDYLQIVTPDSRRANRTEQVSDISRTFQQLAHANGILVVALSQLGRPEKGKGEEKEPTMQDLRESGQIEQDADAVLLLYLEEPSRPNTSRRVLKVGKNKDGERGKFLLSFEGRYQRFRQAEEDPDERQAQTRRYHQTSFADRFWAGLADDGAPVPDPFEEEAKA